jgi:hypothetical protein
MEHIPLPQKEVPDWWRPYTAEFPRWHVWCGVSGLLYARRSLSSPPIVLAFEEEFERGTLARQVR